MQALDGIGAGIFGVVSVIVIADLTRGTGRFNLAQGAIATATGIGAALSNALTGCRCGKFRIQYRISLSCGNRRGCPCLFRVRDAGDEVARNNLRRALFQPFTFPIGEKRATGLLIPASSVAAITSSMSL